MNSEEKMDWIRKNWRKLKAKNELGKAIRKVRKNDPFLQKYHVKDIIDIEESLPKYLN